MFKKIWKLVSSPSMDGDMLDELDGKGDNKAFNRMKEDEERLKFKLLRKSLVKALRDFEDTSRIIKQMVEMESTIFTAKYDSLDVKLLLHSNNESVKSLKSIVAGLSMIAKYAQHLLQKKDQFKTIPLNNQHVRTRILPMNGNGIILHQLGYTVQSDSSFSFPLGVEPDLWHIANLLADIHLFKVEMRYYLSGSHVDAEQIDALLPKSTLLELKQGSIHLMEASVNSVSMQSMMIDNYGVENKEQEKLQTMGSSSDSSPYYSATTDWGSKDSREESPGDGKLVQIDEKYEENEKEEKEKERPMQDFNVQETVSSETTSLKTPSSGFKYECDVCSGEAVLLCKECLNKLLCLECNRTWHKHPSRRHHQAVRLGDIDLAAALDAQNSIVEGPYGVIAQTDTTNALLTKKILAATEKKKKKANEEKSATDDRPQERTKVNLAVELHDTRGINVNETQAHDARETVPRNMPDFGSIMSGNVPVFPGGLNDNNNYVETRSVSASHYSSDLNARGRSQEKKIQPRCGDDQKEGTFQNYSNQQQQQQSIQHQLPQFLQDNIEHQGPLTQDKGAPPHHSVNAMQKDLLQHEGSPEPHNQSNYDGRQGHSQYDGSPEPHCISSHYDSRRMQRGQHFQGRPSPPLYNYHPEQQIPPHIQNPHAQFQNVSSQGDFNPGRLTRHTNQPNQFFPSHPPYPSSHGDPDGHTIPQHPYFHQYPPTPRNQQPYNMYYNQNIPQMYQTTSFQELGPQTPPTELEQPQVSQSLNDVHQDKEQTYVQYPPPMYRYPMSMSQYPRMNHPIPQVPPQHMPLKQSQTFPQFSSLPRKVNEKKDVKQIDRSVSTPSGWSNPASKIIHRILSEPLASRSAVCKFKIDDLSSEINELQRKMDDLLMDEDDDDDDDAEGDNKLEIELMTKKKKELLKTKKELVKFSKEIDNAKEDDELEIYFPPSMDSQKSADTLQKEPCEDEVNVRPGRRSPTKESSKELAVNREMNISKGASVVRPSSLINQNIPEEESITDNRSHTEPLMSVDKDPGKVLLKADHSLTHRQWHCEHCTFLNDISTNVCGMCYRTSDVMQYAVPHENDLRELDEEEGEGGKGEAAVGRDAGNIMLNSCILDLQEEEEKMMAEKKKALEQFYEQQRNSPTQSPPAWLKPTPKTSEPDSKLPVINKQPDTETKKSSTPGKEGAFSDLEKQQDTGSAISSTNTSFNTTSSFNNSPTATATKSTYVATSALRKLRDAASTDEIKTLGLVLVNTIKEADIAGFNVDAVPIALTFYDAQTMTVLGWLRDNWEKNLLKIVEEVGKLGQARDENNIGELSHDEAESACIKCKGNLKHAIELCVKNRESLFEYLNGSGTYSREEILNAIHANKGDKENAEEDLVKRKLQGFLERTWAIQADDVDSMGHQAVNNPLVDICVSGSNIAVGDDGFQTLLKNKDVNRDRRIRMILVEGKLKSWGRAEMVIEILDKGEEYENVCLEDIVEAVCNCTDKQNAIALLQQKCLICEVSVPMTKIRNLSICQCKLCVECLEGHFEVSIREKHVSHWTCPVCFLPDMNSEEVWTDYFHMLQLLLTPVVSKDLIQLLETKVRDFSLQKDPSFRWCIHCGNGFLADNRRGEALTCPHCGGTMCFMCKKMWEPQHEDKTCEEFYQWKIDNDPSNQAIGLAKHLEENGIDCPQCNMRYALAKGGCMHFKCPECGYEFCCGCYEKFYQQGVCKRYKSCDQKGFHCHHPRDCFFYLRDEQVEDLQKLLQLNKVAFNVEVPEDQEDKAHCPVMEQKEDGKDFQCGKDVQRQMAGLCESHYKEYLTGLINKHALDPVLLMAAPDLTNLLIRYEMPLPPEGPDGPDKATLLKVIQEKLPLKRKKLGR